MPEAVVSLPRVTLDIITRDQKVGLEEQRALLVGQVDPGVNATGNASFSGQPANNDTITFNGTAVTFVTSGASGLQVNIAGTLPLTLAALVTLLNASSDVQLRKFVWYTDGVSKLFYYAKTPGTAGNALTVAKSSTAITLSPASTLSGGAAGSYTTTPGSLSASVPFTAAEINEKYGAASHLAMIARAFRTLNDVTNVDALPLTDNASAVQATASVAISGTATRDGTLYLTVVSDELHRYELDILSSYQATDVLAEIASAVNADEWLPFTHYDDAVSTAYFRANNGGTHANDWLIRIEGSVPGLTVTLTGWAGGATNPALTTLLNPVSNIRYQGVVWPARYDVTVIKSFLNARKNVDNDILDGRAFTYINDTLANALTTANTINSSEVVVFWNEPTNQANRWIGPHLPEAPDVLVAKFAAMRARRFETGISIADIVSTNESLDQFGGPAMNSLPYFNTPMLGVGMPYRGSGASQTEQREAEAGGLAVMGVNRSLNEVITGVVVTTWLDDPAGNPDDTWKYLEWRDSHGAIREYCVVNLRKRFAQYRMTNGDVVPNRAIVTVPMMKAYILGLTDDLAGPGYVLVQKGQAQRQYIQDNMVITFDLAKRQAFVTLVVPMVSQLEEILGTIKFTFDINGQ